MRAEIISVGDEIICGQTIDTNAAYLSERLDELGIPVAAHSAVGDYMDAIKDAVGAAAERAEIIIVSGGLGPTHDDITREAVAELANVNLVLDAPSLEHIRNLFAARGIEMPLSNVKQAMLPEGGDILPNSAGTAAGFRLRLGRASIFVVPGVPSEMRTMFEEQIVPRLPAGQGMVVTRVLRCFGMSESLIGETLATSIDLHGDPNIAFLAVDGIICVKFTARAESRDAALARIKPVCEMARSLLGEVVFGEGVDTLEVVVAQLLAEKKLTLAVAESCTGGLICDRLTDVAGMSNHLLEGLVTYSNESKTRLLGVPVELIKRVGAVSEEVARAMAEGVRARAGADIGVSVTGIAGPGGGSAEKPVGTVHIALADAVHTLHRELFIPGVRAQIKDRAAKSALNLLRLELIHKKQID